MQYVPGHYPPASNLTYPESTATARYVHPRFVREFARLGVARRPECYSFRACVRLFSDSLIHTALLIGVYRVVYLRLSMSKSFRQAIREHNTPICVWQRL